ncbi:sensor domain-containing diguanylate cyclase [Oceanicoccus sp. KOV_DT_Chl]|uniref:sensor domain-containing diguanylate cyclase n=1 Tax=Oceanicoccus sp. KOV_DT_Chl TaxID=1904639 RepID=UPI000C7A5EB3|nr:sensor domain-containing diguanylate cyclase [Oceanicoccus sp. KOV_DT_Chl]
MRRNSGRLERKSGSLAGRRLENLSTTVSELFQKATQNEQILRRYQQFELKLLDHSGLEELLDMLLRNAMDYFQLDAVELWLYDPQNTLAELLPEDYLGIPGLHLFSNTAAMDRLYGKNPAVRLVSTNEGKSLPVCVGKELRSAALLPLVRQGVLVGSLHFASKGHQRFTLDKSTDFIAHLASIVSVCFENAVNQERLHRLSMYDMLTRVKNRRAFHLALDKEVSRATRSGDPLSLLFIDLDYFKQINDTYGHPMGDKVLKEVAQYINEMLRKTDHVCRYGGEEFALVLPNCGQQRAMEIAERIRQQISELLIENEDAEEDSCREISVTLSMGVCCWLPQGEEDIEADIAKDLIACSDQGVYLSKAAGRNAIHYVALNKATAPASV